MRFAGNRSLLVSACMLTLVSLTAAGILVSPEFARSQSSSNAAAISDNTPGFIHKAKDMGPVNPNTTIAVTVWLRLRNGARLDQMAQQMYQKGSPNYHKWLNQSDFNAGFAPTAQAVNAVENFLTAHGLSVLTVAENNFYIKVQGTVGDVERAFHVQINNYSLHGKTYRSNTGNPSIAAPVNGLVAGITGMDDLGFQPDFVRPTLPDGKPFPMIPLSSSPTGLFFEGQCFRAPETHTFPANANSNTVPQATYTGNRYGADITNTTLGHLASCGYQPSEVQTAYNMIPLYQQGMDGTGQTIVIVDAYGSPTIRNDAAAFSFIYGLPQPDLTVLRAPGVVNNPHGAGWDTETTLDVEWAHAMAPGAKIVLVIGPTSNADLDEAMNWAVVHHLGNTISNSWSTFEGLANPAVFNRDNRILEMAAVQGIDVNFASGDWGDNTSIVGFKTASFPASSPFATGVGGTSLGLNPDNTIGGQTGWGNNATKIANPVSAGGTPVIPPVNFGFQFGAGGGASVLYAKPSFQSGLPGNVRLLPDISFLADPFTGVEFIQTVDGGLGVGVVGGTSLATPMFSAVMAIAAQKAGHALGQAAQLLYNLPAGAVSDIVPLGSADDVSGTITTADGTTAVTAVQLAAPLENTTTFYSAFYNGGSTTWYVLTFGTDSSLTTATGWDNVTGVGTPNGLNFVNAIAP